MPRPLLKTRENIQALMQLLVRIKAKRGEKIAHVVTRLEGRWKGATGSALTRSSIDDYIRYELESPYFWLSLRESGTKGPLIDYTQMRLRACERFNQYLEALGYQSGERQNIFTDLAKYNPVIHSPESIRGEKQ